MSCLSVVTLRITALILIGSGFCLRLPVASAMDRRSAPRERASPQRMAPEIEIITMSDQARQDFSDAPQPQLTVAPAELLPPVSPSKAAAQNKSRVEQIQTALKNAGFDPGSIDGQSGPRTKKAIRAFQRAHNLVVDGIVGEQTWGRLQSYLPSEKSKE